MLLMFYQKVILIPLDDVLNVVRNDALIRVHITLINILDNSNVPVVLADTHGACHLEAKLIKEALNNLPLEKLELLIIENVGNLVCPASFDLGTNYNIVIASVPEGDDKPYKYPKMFKGADIVILNKTDYLKSEPFNLEYFTRGVEILNQNTQIFPLSCKTDESVNKWINWIKDKLA